MGRKNKLQKFADIRRFPNVFECYDVQNPQLLHADQPVEMRGNWQSEHFKNTNPITLELACGGGEYTVELARRFPNRNFIGVDVKGNRIWKGASQALAAGLENAAFLRTRIEIIDQFFAASEVDEIWITFPDPFLRESKSNRRLTSAFFLEKYRALLKPNGLVHLKTDEPNLYQFTLETIAADPRCRLLFHDADIHKKPLQYAELDIKTFYEAKDIAGEKSVKYVRFSIH